MCDGLTRSLIENDTRQEGNKFGCPVREIDMASVGDRHSGNKRNKVTKSCQGASALSVKFKVELLGRGIRGSMFLTTFRKIFEKRGILENVGPLNTNNTIC